MFTVFFPLMFLSGLFGSGAKAALKTRRLEACLKYRQRAAHAGCRIDIWFGPIWDGGCIDDADSAQRLIDGPRMKRLPLSHVHSQHDAAWIETSSILPEVAWVDANYLITLNNVPND